MLVQCDLYQYFKRGRVSRFSCLTSSLNFRFMEYHGRITKSIISWQEDIDETSEMKREEAENPVPHIHEDPVHNIDEGDEGNPLAVAEYIKDISRFYCETEVIL